MQTHDIVSRNEWIAARRELLAEEKAWTRERDRLAWKRRALPWDGWLDIVPKGRNETKQGNLMDWVKRHDQYEPAGEAASCCADS